MKLIQTESVFLVLYLGYFKCVCSVVINSESPKNVELSFTTPCAIPEIDDNGFCVHIELCTALNKFYNTSTIQKRKCGLSNENQKNFYVCCEKYFIDHRFSTTEIPQTLTCGTQLTISDRILGGEPSSQEEYPWLGRLHRKSGETDQVVFSCTGTLISEKAVLTSAHCILSPNLKQLGDLYAVSFGEHKVECPQQSECLQNKQTGLISKTVVHPQYDVDSVNHDNDIALIILQNAVNVTKFVVPICLEENNSTTSEYHVSGWGKTETGLQSDVKLKTTLPPYSWEQCVKKYHAININLTERQVCAGGVEGFDTCLGDSGGPLMVFRNEKWFVEGVVSFGLGCGKKGWPGVYAYVPCYIDWIKANIEK